MKIKWLSLKKTIFPLIFLIPIVTIYCSCNLFNMENTLQTSHTEKNSGSTTLLQLNNVRSNPYGITVYEKFSPTTVSYLKRLGITWIRYQQNWWTIEPARNDFYWQPLDDAVALANKNHIHITLPIQGAPDWSLTQKCGGFPYLPGVEEITQFARTLASRYNGTHGHGYVDSYEIGNEEYDGNDNLSCRDASSYGPSLKSAYLAIKAVSPRALVGMCGLWWTNTPHIYAFMQWLYQHGYGSYFDFANYHYYICNGNPTVTEGDRPSFNEEWTSVHSVLEKYHNGDKPIWVTEVGWNINGIDQDPHCTVTPKIQAEYVHDVLREAMQSHVIRRIFWYTIDRGNDGMSLTQQDGPLPSFYMLQSFIYKHPHWN